jgi:hypothetical protein
LDYFLHLSKSQIIIAKELAEPSPTVFVIKCFAAPIMRETGGQERTHVFAAVVVIMAASSTEKDGAARFKKFFFTTSVTWH